MPISVTYTCLALSGSAFLGYADVCDGAPCSYDEESAYKTSDAYKTTMVLTHSPLGGRTVIWQYNFQTYYIIYIKNRLGTHFFFFYVRQLSGEYKRISLMRNQHWFRYWFNLTNVDFSSKVFCGINLRAITQEMLMKSIHNTCLEITLSKLLKHFAGPSELTLYVLNFLEGT